MAEPNTMDNRTLWRRTLITVAAMVGGCAVVVGSLTLIAASVVGRAGGAGATEQAATPGLAPAGNVHGAVAGPKPPGAAPMAK
jgi:hypothetical protein